MPGLPQVISAIVGGVERRQVEVAEQLATLDQLGDAAHVAVGPRA